MLEFIRERFSSFSLKKILILLLAVSTLILAYYNTPSLQTLMPRIVGNLTNSLSYLKDQIFNNNRTNNWKETKRPLHEAPETDLFTSPYIITPKIYNTAAKRHNSSRKQKVISCYNCPQWFLTAPENLYNRDFKVCPYSQCTFDTGKRKSTADVVLFFVGQMGKSEVPPRPAGQIWVKCFWESPAHYSYPTPYEPWKSAFNWTFNYRTDSDIFAPSNRLAWRNRTDLLTDSVYLEIAKNKTRSVAWFVSHCHTQSKREIYVKEMQKYIDVDIYGKCGTKSCTHAEEKECETKLTSTYKFYLSFENSFCKDYVTEKLLRSIQYRSHIVPVVRGGFDYNRYIPNGIFVNSANFSSAKDLSLYLKELGEDHERYARMLKEKDKLTTLNYKFDWCDVCEKLHTDNRTKVIPDIKEWSHKDACHAPVDLRKS